MSDSFRHAASFAILVAFGLLAVGSSKPAAAPPKAEPIPEVEPDFGFKLKEEKVENSDNFTIAIIQPLWKFEPQESKGNDAPIDIGDLPKQFTKAMAHDFESMLTTRGMNVSGPFPAIEEMTFPDKKQSDLALFPKIEIELKLPVIHVQTEYVNQGAGPVPVQTFVMQSPGNTDPKVAATGSVYFEVWEPLSNQKVWKKPVPDLKESKVCGPRAVWPDRDRWERLLRSCVTEFLNDLYPKIMGQGAKYFTREEMVLVRKQSQELREKKVY